MTPTMTRADAERRIKLAASDRVAVVAGSGRLPVNVAESLAEAGHLPFIVMLAGEADDDPKLASFEHDRLALEEIGSLLPLLKRYKITHVVLAGGVSRRPHWRQIRPTFALFRILPKILMALARGDDGLLRVIIGEIEAEGLKVVGAHEIVPDLLAPEGPMTRARPRKGDLADLDAALAASRAIGALDIGQAAVAIGGRVIALEGVEGTRKMRQARPGISRRPSGDRPGHRRCRPRCRPCRHRGRGRSFAGAGFRRDGQTRRCARPVRGRPACRRRTMSEARPLKIAIIAGEESGDLLGADIVRALQSLTSREVRLVGTGGRHLQELGLAPLFDASEIALMGVSAILRDLPRLIRRIGETARAVVAEKPDCLITIDSPDFTLRVAKKVRARDPSIPIVHYVCPSVWAWRPGRAPAMRPHVDHILCLLPFEAAELQRLGGPPGTYVGHRLTQDEGVRLARSMQDAPRDLSKAREKTLLLLPGSRKGEVKSLIGVFGETVSVLRSRGHRMRMLLPTVPHVAGTIEAAVAGWEEKPEIILDQVRKWQAFGEADAALIASGTVSLELALAGVPSVSSYRLDPVARLIQRLVTVWSALLPNLIADRPVVPEFYNQYVRPENLARHIEALWGDTALRAWQKDGFVEVASRMRTDRPSGEIAAEIVLRHVSKH
jgi:lipid-A-disaccharide synthase